MGAGKARILVLGPALTPSGYARVIAAMLWPIRHYYDFHQFALNYRGAACSDGGWPIYPNTIDGDPYGLVQLPSLIEAIKPDIILIVFDIFLYYAQKSRLEREFPKIPIISYCPIDGDNADFAYLARLSGLARLVLFTDFARSVVEEAHKRAVASAGAMLPPIAVIPHGTDIAIFRPLCTSAGNEPDIAASRTAARRTLFPGQPELQRAFIVLNANQNNPRKRMDLTLEGFARFARGKSPDIRLYLHTNMHEWGCELLPIARRLGIEERLLYTSRDKNGCSVSDAQLNVIYNACDVGINTSVGEGWGLVAFEHAAVGAAQIVPCNSVHEELWNEAATLVPTTQLPRNRLDFVTYRAVSPDGVAAALEQLYNNPHLLHSRALSAFGRAVSPSRSWERIAHEWDRLFDEVLVELKKPSGRSRG
jgi:glycosyltransferase involved in cell wall biosynthesis